MSAALASAYIPVSFRCPASSSSSKLCNIALVAFRPQQLVRKAERKVVSSSGRGILSINASVASSNGTADESGSDSAEYIPKADFYKVEAILRPWRLTHVAASLIDSGIRGVTVTDVRGFGSQLGSRERYAGSEFSEDSLVAKVKLEIVVSKDQVEAVVDTIITEARTGEIGDGKIFISPVVDVIRVRTGERGFKAERMIGGRADILARKEN
ncbi:unnamed protein product [Calypogeia fissa]